MSRTIKQFSYSITEMEDGKFGPPPTAAIQLDHWSEGKDGVSTLISNLINEEEIDANIALLKADLDAVAVKAKAALRAARERAGTTDRFRNTN